MSDLELAFEVLQRKAERYGVLFDYYEGEQPLTYMNSSRMRKIFEGLNRHFAQNWCSVVIDAVRDRINLRAIEVRGAGAAKWQELWEGSQIELESDDVHEAELIAGESFVVCWRNDAGVMESYFNDPRLCHVFYEAEFPRVKRFAAKRWVDDEKRLRMTLYYADRLEYYRSTVKADTVSSAQGLEPFEGGTAVNPFGEVPVFHFRKARRVRSDLTNVLPIQDSVNKLNADMMVAAEFGAFKQRYVISNAEVQGKLRNSPDEIWDLPAGDGVGQQTMAGQFDATPLSNYLDGIDKLVIAISSITRTPKHYFFAVGSNLSGEALIAMESSLNKKAQDRIDRYAPEWRNVALFMLRHAGVEVKAEDVTVRFDKPETIQPFTVAQARQMNVAAGVPLETVLRDEGKNDGYIKRMLKDGEAEKARQADSLGNALVQAERRFNAGGGA